MNETMAFHIPVIINETEHSDEYVTHRVQTPAEWATTLEDARIASVQAAWSVVLRGYSLLDHVSFDCLYGQRQGPCSVALTDGQTFEGLTAELLKKVQTDESDKPVEGDNDTSIIFVSGTHIHPPRETIQVRIFDNALIHLVHHSSRLSRKAGERLSRSLTNAITAVLTTPEALTSTFQVVDARDADHNAYRLPPSSSSCVHWEIAAQIKAQPNSHAVVSTTGSLTYKELGVLSLQLANRLVASGVKPKDFVVICLPKSFLPVLAMVATQIAGAAFVLLDQAAPDLRWKAILDAANPKLVLCDESLQPRMATLTSSILVLGDKDLQISSTPTGSLSWENAPASSTDTSHVLFTSGSTGKPKGILMPHHVLCSSSDGWAAQLGIGPSTRVFQFASFAFDVSVLDTLVTLMRGGCVCVPTEHERLNDLAGTMTRLKATFLFVTPTVAGLIRPEDVPFLKQLVVGGEPIGNDVVSKWEGNVSLYGGYGPAETSVSSLVMNLVDGKRSQIGRPVSSAFTVVDPSRPTVLVPDGCVGELLIQGPLLADGYLSSSAGENSSWVQANEEDRLPPYVPRAKAYRTGDLVRKCPDGTYDFVGRRDSQVKIRGQRVELGEVEAHLSRVLPAGMRAVVALLRVEAGLNNIVAFLWHAAASTNAVALVSSLSGAEKEVIDGIMSTLTASLPSYMLPSSLLVLDGAPPQTASGKIDRTGLVSLAATAPASLRQLFSSSYPGSDPSTDALSDEKLTALETRLRHVWASALGIPPSQISRRSHFFGLGGDSATAIRAVAEAGRRGVRVTVAQMMEQGTLGGLAAVATEAAEGRGRVVPFSLLPGGLDKRRVMAQVYQQIRVS